MRHVIDQYGLQKVFPASEQAYTRQKTDRWLTGRQVKGERNRMECGVTHVGRISITWDLKIILHGQNQGIIKGLVPRNKAEETNTCVTVKDF